MGDVHITCSFDLDKVSKGITSSIVAAAAGILIGLPILGILAGVLIKLRNDKKREEAKQQIRRKLQGEVYPQVLREVGRGIEKEITKQIALVNTSIEEELKMQRDTLEKSIADVRAEMVEEKAKKDSLVVTVKNDLERIHEIKTICDR
jgi:hypothetical protein